MRVANVHFTYPMIRLMQLNQQIRIIHTIKLYWYFKILTQHILDKRKLSCLVVEARYWVTVLICILQCFQVLAGTLIHLVKPEQRGQLLWLMFHSNHHVNTTGLTNANRIITIRSDCGLLRNTSKHYLWSEVINTENNLYFTLVIQLHQAMILVQVFSSCHKIRYC